MYSEVFYLKKKSITAFYSNLYLFLFKYAQNCILYLCNFFEKCQKNRIKIESVLSKILWIAPDVSVLYKGIRKCRLLKADLLQDNFFK